MSNIKSSLKNAISSHEQYCDGFHGGNYITGIVLNVGVADLKFHHSGSWLLDSIIAFDRAEVASTNIGQINMITVSSFCGVGGLIWGYDIARHPNLYKKHELLKDYHIKGGLIKKNIPVYSAEALQESLFKLFGSIKEKRFPLIPGAHVPCAGKHISMIGPKHIYAAMGFGIAKHREKDACLFMEDIGQINEEVNFYEHDNGFVNKNKNSNTQEIKTKILKNMAKSIIEVGKTQNIEFKEIFVDMVDIVIKENQVGCALVAAPYFSLAKNAISENDLSLMSKYSLFEWENQFKKCFLKNKR